MTELEFKEAAATAGFVLNNPASLLADIFHMPRNPDIWIFRLKREDGYIHVRFPSKTPARIGRTVEFETFTEAVAFARVKYCEQAAKAMSRNLAMELDR